MNCQQHHMIGEHNNNILLPIEMQHVVACSSVIPAVVVAINNRSNNNTNTSYNNCYSNKFSWSTTNSQFARVLIIDFCYCSCCPECVQVAGSSVPMCCSLDPWVYIVVKEQQTSQVVHMLVHSSTYVALWHLLMLPWLLMRFHLTTISFARIQPL